MALSAIELRIGNILKYNTEKMNTMYPEFYWRATNIGVKSFKCKGHSGINFEPIPLSEEILLKLGFVEDEPFLELEITPGYGIQYYQYKTDKNKISIYSGTTVISNDCKYLHQLQNLYFSLTGQELNTSGL